jgi:SpoVK/Ycf46/Vps4 family AAA+-type ATPase
VAGFLRVLIKTELVGKSVKESPPNDKAVLAVADVIKYTPCVIDPNVATETPAPTIALIAL